MRRALYTFALGVAFLLPSVPAYALYGAGGADGNGRYFAIISSQMENGGALPRSAVDDAHGCNGQNVAPSLEWSGAPAATRSFAVSMFDPDAPNGGFLHWAVLNIPDSAYVLSPDSASGKTNALPGNAALMRNSYGNSAYAGACPPRGETHHYEFTVYAMPDRYEFYPFSQTGPSTIAWLREHALASATLSVTYTRN
ncbi:MAG: YbhB/YbcL family Raf kinase inhibitor-like protein [Alphaproteobacteria bacterium]|nr:YbhB/YbcL family Raf kinase inhibitor-like protein [Alphaproteobacteria bacterium]USO07991.1 MAG: YbhB/YbcL family Raf kinase inhibitor-like protein [Rhodospirillales bacterium]